MVKVFLKLDIEQQKDAMKLYKKIEMVETKLSTIEPVKLFL